jgi:hypothetical protein
MLKLKSSDDKLLNVPRGIEFRRAGLWPDDRNPDIVFLSQVSVRNSNQIVTRDVAESASVLEKHLVRNSGQKWTETASSGKNRSIDGLKESEFCFDDVSVAKAFRF